MNLRAKLHVYGYAGTYPVSGYTSDIATDWTDKNNVFVDYADASNLALQPTAVFPQDETE